MEPTIYIGQDAVEALGAYCAEHGLDRFELVADPNTYAALGRTVDEALTGRGYDVHKIILTGDEIIADEYYIMQVLLQAPQDKRTYLAVGSGTLTDITRFVSHRTRTGFISLPTAASVDGFTSIGSPLVIGRLKQTIYAQPPDAVFGDLNTLCAAPRRMTASGFGDILGKYISLADWRLGRLLWDEEYSDAVEQRTRKALDHCVSLAGEIGQASCEGVSSLLDGLIESGLCMVEFGSSRPAAGAEHYLSHYWEMLLLRDNRPAIFHGAKVGVGTVMMAPFYEQVRQMSRDEVARRLAASKLPDRKQEEARIHEGYGPLAEPTIAEMAPFLELTEETYAALKQRILDNWAAVQTIADTVPPVQDIVNLLHTVGGAVKAQELGLTDQDVALAMEYSHYHRNRFTIAKLSRILGLMH